MNRTTFTIFICLTLAFGSGCDRRSKTTPPQKAPEGQQLLIGLIPEQNLFRQMERFEPLARYLSLKAGVQIT